ncbi:MAG: HAMP domain-containing histidine kinase [Candidatus Marinimicrobia bacterium]|nr:HAMP domain-containing histidine kinase [Candidatus Neomarinimicrobiota bacterium]
MMHLFRRLSWKLAIVTGILVCLVVLALSIPIYWQTRNTLEDQLADHLRTNIESISEKLDPGLIDFIRKYPGSTIVKDSLVESLNHELRKYSAGAIYLIDRQENIFLVAGNRASAVQSSMIHKHEIQKSRAKGIAFSPLFSNTSGKTYKSVFKVINIDNASEIVLGLDADARFLKYTARLRRRIISIGIIVLIFSIIAASILSQTLTRPLRLLSRFARDIGKGRAETTNFQRRYDEIGFLGKTMENMRHEIDQREKDNKQLIASVAHEIRNPLAGMQVNAELLLETTRKMKEIHSYSRAVAKEIANLSNIVENFLAYARPIESTLTSQSIRAILEEIITNIQQDFPNHIIKIYGDGSATIHQGKIKHAFFNILKNACESSAPNMEIVISIQSKNEMLSISFLNQGPPIPVEIQSQIFEAFFSTKSSGVGLGLSISKSIVEQHGGKILLTRSDSSGTEFVIQLPTG